MNKSQAIKRHCLECAVGSPKEVTLCHIVECPLWQFRFGYSIKDKRYKKRIDAAKKKYPEVYKEMLQLLSEHTKNMPNLPEYVQIHAVLEKENESERDMSVKTLSA